MRAIVAVLLSVTAIHAALWGLLRDEQKAPDFNGMLPSLSYAPFEGTGHPDVDNIPNKEKIRADLKKLATMTKAIRLYSSTGGVELVPPIAAEFGLKVTVGAWIDKNVDRNEREIAAALDLAKRNSNVIGIVVGNETIYRGEQKVEDLIELIQRVKKQTNVPVTTGEIWNIWRDYPQLASSVDFIAAHILPYWENFTDRQTVDQALYIYGHLREIFPGKRIVIAEFGWPSAGYNLKNANPGPFEQAWVLRNFVTRAEAIGMDYNIVEAIDQPWKFFEGGVGPYWGILNASREPKFAWTGPIVDPDYWKIAGIALLVGVLLSLPIFRLAASNRHASRRAGRGSERRRRMGCHGVRLLEHTLLRLRFSLCAHVGPYPIGAVGPDRHGAHRGNRDHCLRPQARAPHCGGASHSRRLRAESVDPRPGLF
jgi:exo-beta-1,3-glucanase (GH17 family)